MSSMGRREFVALLGGAAATPAKRHPVAKRGPRAGCVSSGSPVRLSAFWLDALVANISKLFRPLEKPSLAGVPFLVRG
jgi:hypothetical protein